MHYPVFNINSLPVLEEAIDESIDDGLFVARESLLSNLA